MNLIKRSNRLFSITQKATTAQGGFVGKDGQFDMEAF